MRISPALALFLPSLLFAQSHIRTEAPSSRSDVFVGALFNGNNPASNAGPGILGGVDFRILGPIGADAQVGVSINGTNGDNTITLVDYLFGPRIQARASNRLAPFADFLVGGQNLKNSSTQHTYYYTNGGGVAAAGDAGADVRLTRRIALRGQFGFVFSNFAVVGAGPIGNYRWRGGVNLVYRF